MLKRSEPFRLVAGWFPAHLAALVLLGLMLAALYPMGYIGGGADDGRYLEAVRCVVSKGYCVPLNHWAARLPLVLPAAAAVSLFGEGRGTLMLVPLAYGTGSLLLFALLVRRVAGERAALIASLALLGTPIFVSRWPRLNVDIPELFFLTAALSLLLAAIDRDRARFAVLAGAAIGLAVLSRASAIAAAPIIVAGLALFTPRPVKWTMLLALGGAIILAGEAAWHALTAGRPFLSWELAHAHARIPSTALPATVDLGRSPILNADFIANWSRPAGIHVHWLLDGALNLLAYPLIALTLWASLLLAIAAALETGRKTPLWQSASARLGWFLAAAAAAHFCILTFVLAVHPTARMFLPIACVGAFTVGVWTDCHRERVHRAITVSILVTLLAVTALIGVGSIRFLAYEEEAERWVRIGPERPAISPTAASVFALSPLLAGLEPARQDTRGPVIHLGDCESRGRERQARSFVDQPDWQLPYDMARKAGLANRRLTLCLVSPADPAASPRPSAAPPARRVPAPPAARRCRAGAARRCAPPPRACRGRADWGPWQGCARALCN